MLRQINQEGKILTITKQSQSIFEEESPKFEKELEFLIGQGFSIKDIRKVGYMTVTEYKPILKEIDIPFALVDKPCKKGGHFIKTRYGHCPMCDSSKISYMKRFRESGYVYLAFSKIGDFFKIGQAKEINKRQNSLQYEKYGGVDDWELLYYVESSKSGTVENLIHKELSSFKITSNYFVGDYTKTAKELFRCEEVNIRKAFEKIANSY